MAAGDGGRPREPGSHGRPRPAVHHPGAPPGGPLPADRSGERRTSGDWQEVPGGTIDSTRPYLCRLPSGRSIALFFYDGPIARAVAFEDLLEDGARFTRRLLAGFAGDRERAPARPHRHRRRDLRPPPRPRRDGPRLDPRRPGAGRVGRPDQLRRAPGAPPAGPRGGDRRGDLLELRPRDRALALRLRLPHRRPAGLEPALARRRSATPSTGCATSWRRASRRPPASCSTTRGPPGTATSRCSSTAPTTAWTLLRPPRPPGAERRGAHPRALRLLELQRHAIYMYTSCGWFFNDLSGIETVQVLQYAGRALQLAERVFQNGFEEGFLERLEQAKSNLPASAGRRHGPRDLRPRGPAGAGRPDQRGRPLRPLDAVRGVPGARADLLLRGRSVGGADLEVRSLSARRRPPGRDLSHHREPPGGELRRAPLRRSPHQRRRAAVPERGGVRGDGHRGLDRLPVRRHRPGGAAARPLLPGGSPTPWTRCSPTSAVPSSP